MALVEHMDTQRCKNRKAQTRIWESEQFFKTPKLRTHKKMRSKKFYKLFLAPEALLPFTGLAQDLAVEEGPSVAATKAQALAAVPVSLNKSVHGDGKETRFHRRETTRGHRAHARS